MISPPLRPYDAKLEHLVTLNTPPEGANFAKRGPEGTLITFRLKPRSDIIVMRPQFLYKPRSDSIKMCFALRPFGLRTIDRIRLFASAALGAERFYEG